MIDIELTDDKLGIIATQISLAKGEVKKITRTATLNETVTSFAEVSGTYYKADVRKVTKAYDCVTVKVR